MKSVEKTGKTVEEAINSALEEMGVDRDLVDIEVLEEANKGFLGIGMKEARVRLSLETIEDLEEPAVMYAKQFLMSVLSNMDITAEICVLEEGEDTVSLEIKGETMGVIIGKRGDTLNALQYLTNLAVKKQMGRNIKVLIDTENYKNKREETLKKLAERMADKATRNRRNVTLDNMNPYERRIIHAALQGKENIKTRSVGEDPNRRVVIEYCGERY